MRTRRGISSVVGMAFGIIAIMTSIGYVTYSMNLLNQYNQSVLARNQESIDKGIENFQLYGVKIVNDKFNVTITNTGNLPINITRMWIQNASATDWDNFYSIDKVVSPGNTLINIGQNSAVYANPNNMYNIKLVTSRGNSIQFNLGSPGAKPLFMQLMFAPNSVKTAWNSTLIFVVTNNMTSNNLLANVKPSALSCTAGPANPSWSIKSGPSPAQYPFLPGGGTAIFRWVVQITGTAGTGAWVTCTASLANGLASNTASDTIWLTQ